MNKTQLTEKSGKSKIHISSEPDWNLFESIATTLEHELNGVWIGKTDGIDQRYWDLKIENEILTVHLEHYLGILVFSESKSMLLRAKQIIESHSL